MYKISLQFFLTIALLFAISQTNLFAAPDPPPGDGPCGSPFGGPACPIDGGVSILIAAGLAYGGKKTYDLSRKRA